MQTITFYSYKGGVGRTLLVANVAQYLSRFGQKVVMMDFDLEAPGLHYKLPLAGDPPPTIECGVLDYIHAFAVEGKGPGPLGDVVVEVARRREGAPIHMLPAGKVPTPDYWRKLSRINWHELFYSPNATGIPFFLELKARIETEFAPDYLLIDSRTGITEVGGVATSILPDAVVCLLLTNRENREGAREVMRGIQRAVRLREQSPIKVVPVLARLPLREDSDAETRLVEQVLAFLNEDAPDLSDSHSFSSLPILHTDRAIEVEEAVLLDREPTLDPSPLLRDYLNLFAQLIPPALLQSQVQPLVDAALKRIWEDPDGVERELVDLAAFYEDPTAYRALLQLYFLRKAPDAKILKIASRVWELTRDASDPRLWPMVKALDEHEFEELAVQLGFLEAVWSLSGSGDPRFGDHLAAAYHGQGRYTDALRVAHLLLAAEYLPAEIVIRLLRRLRDADEREAAFSFLRRTINRLGGNLEFLAECGRLIRQYRATEQLDAIVHVLQTRQMSELLAGDAEVFGWLLAVSKSEGGLQQFLQEFLRGHHPDSLPTWAQATFEALVGLPITTEQWERALETIGQPSRNSWLRMLRKRLQ